MKTIQTIPGKSYSVHSSAGCTVSDDSGWSKTLEAPEDYFTAHSGKVYIDDDTATVRELFKLAPYQKLRLLGVVGGDKLPYGYTRLEYLETTGTQWIDTGIVKSDKYRARVEYAAPPAFISGDLFGWAYNHNGVFFRNKFYFYNGRYFGRFVHYSSGDYIMPVNLPETGYDGTARNVLESTSAADRIILNGKMVTLSGLGSVSNATNPLNTPISLLKGSPGVKVFSFTIFNDSDLVDVDLIPILDNTGEPCMFDFVTLKPFYNSGTGTFIAGVENQVQLNNLLRKLPDRTGQDVGTLQVRLADELQTPENEAKLDAMLAKNWEISQAA